MDEDESNEKRLEIVEKILTRLFILGKIKEDCLPKDALRSEAFRYTRQNGIEDFKFQDIPKVMLKHDYCYFMRKEIAHSSKHFHVNTKKIKTLVEKHEGSFSEEMISEANEGECDAASFNLKYIITMKKETLKTKPERSAKLINLTANLSEDEDKYIFEITPNENETNATTTSRVEVECPKNEDFSTLSTYEDENCAKFDMYLKDHPNVNQPYAILIYTTLGCNTLILTKYEFTIKELDTVEPIKVMRSALLNRETMDVEPLSDFYPSEEMKSLTQKKFVNLDLSEEENCLLYKIDNLLDSGVTKLNYVGFWKTMIEMEDCAEIEKERISDYDKKDQKLIEKFEKVWNLRQVLIFYVLPFPKLSDNSPITEGTEVVITPSSCRQSHTKDPRNIYARVHQVRKYYLVLELKDMRKDERLDTSVLYDIHFLPNRVTAQMQMQAINFVESHGISKFFFPTQFRRIQSILKGKFEWINESVKSNPEQQSAIMHIVGKSSFPAPYILMGPPGTGKTTTIVEAVCQIIKRNPEARILVAASSNYASDVIALRLLEHLPETCVYRMFSGSQESNIRSIDRRLLNASNLSDGSHYYPTLHALSEYNIILTTVTIAGKFAQARINHWHFEYVFIDESGSCTEPSTLIPIAGVISSEGKIHGQVILAGDPMQLGPVVKADKAEARLGVSLLERLIDTGIYRRNPTTGKYNPRVLTKLLRNFRSHPKILEYPNNEFYDGELMAKGSPEVTHWACDWKYLSNKSVPIVFEHVVGQSKQDKGTPSLFNRKEIDRVIFNIQRLLSYKKFPGKQITQKCIGVISPYKKQCEQIIFECNKRNWRDIEVGSVDKFQGQEKPVIILSTVRSKTRSVGFLNNPKRLNVALTRAQALLIIVGNVDTLKRDPTWGRLINFYRGNNVIKWVLEEKMQALDLDDEIAALSLKIKDFFLQVESD